MRRDELYLQDIVEAAGHISDFIAGLEFSAFQDSELIRSAVVQKLAVIGEAAARISDELKARHPEIPWPKNCGVPQHLGACIFRHRRPVVWLATTKQAPELRDQVAPILRAEFDRPDDAV